MSNVEQIAMQLAEAIEESEHFTALKAAYEGVMENDIAKKKFDDFRSVQIELQQKQMSGQEITEEEVAKANEAVESIGQHEIISKLMEKEQSMNEFINMISRKITTPLEALYNNTNK